MAFFGTFEFIKNGYKMLGVFYDEDNTVDHFAVDVLEIIEYVEDFDDDSFQLLSCYIKKVPCVRIITSSRRMRVKKVDMLRSIYVVEEHWFLDGHMPLFRPGMKGIYRIR